MRKILIVHTGGGLGDVLLATPVIEALKFNYPEAEIDFLVLKKNEGAVKNHPLLHKVMTMDAPRPTWLQVISWSQKLKAEKYDAALILWSNTKLAAILYLAGIPVRIGQSSRLSYSWTYTHQVIIRSENNDTTSHWSHILLDFVRILRLPVPPFKPKFIIPEAAESRAQKLLEGLPDLPGPIIGIHPSKGISDPESRWPTAIFASWLKILAEKLQARLIVTGGSHEKAVMAKIIAQSGVPCLDLSGRTDLDSLAAVMKRCQVFICPDSGPAHLAAVCGTPVVDIFALKEDFPHRWAPVGAPSVILRPQQWDCQERCFKGKCRHFSCYRHISPEMILDAVSKLLEESKRRQAFDADSLAEALDSDNI